MVLRDCGIVYPILDLGKEVSTEICSAISEVQREKRRTPGLRLIDIYHEALNAEHILLV